MSKTRKTKTKGEVTDIFYICTLPESLKNFLGCEDKLYFQQANNKVLISNDITGEEYTIKKSNHISIPRRFFKFPDQFKMVKFIVDLNKCVEFHHAEMKLF